MFTREKRCSSFWIRCIITLGGVNPMIALRPDALTPYKIERIFSCLYSGGLTRSMSTSWRRLVKAGRALSNCRKYLDNMLWKCCRVLTDSVNFCSEAWSFSRNSRLSSSAAALCLCSASTELESRQTCSDKLVFSITRRSISAEKLVCECEG